MSAVGEVGEAGGEEYRRVRERRLGENRPSRIREGGEVRVNVKDAVLLEVSLVRGKSGVPVDMVRRRAEKWDRRERDESRNIVGLVAERRMVDGNSIVCACVRSSDRFRLMSPSSTLFK